MKKFRCPYKRVTVYWLDASTHSGWREPDSIDDTFEIVTTGYLLSESKICVKIAGSVASTGQVADVTVVPRGMLQKIVRL